MRSFTDYKVIKMKVLIVLVYVYGVNMRQKHFLFSRRFNSAFITFKELHMKTKRLYLNDTFKFNHEGANVVKIDSDRFGQYVILDETLFHPQGGGQASDIGLINETKVKKVINDGELVRHYIDGETTLEEGQTVSLAIDPETRLENAALHSCGHLLAALLRERHGFARQIGGHHFPGESRVTFHMDGKAAPKKEQLIDEINAEVEAGKKISTEDVEGERFIAIETFESGRCAGTHLSSTSQIEGFSIRNIKTKKQELSVGYSAGFAHKLASNSAIFSSEKQKEDAPVVDHKQQALNKSI